MNIILSLTESYHNILQCLMLPAVLVALAIARSIIWILDRGER